MFFFTLHKIREEQRYPKGKNDIASVRSCKNQREMRERSPNGKS